MNKITNISMDKIIDNIEALHKQFGNVIDDNKKLLLLYWQKIDGVSMDKQYISTVDFMEKATDVEVILSGKRMFDVLNGRR